MQRNNKGFTLIELLVVIAIIAVISVVVILTLNPVQLIAQAQDSNRISDMSVLKTAMSDYLADQGSSAVITGALATCYESGITSSASGPNCGFQLGYTAIVTGTAASSQRAVNGNGWIPVNFSAISSGAPFGNLPVDPINTGATIYRYAASGTSLGSASYFQVNADLVSAKQTTAGGADFTDGGPNNALFEVGNVPGLSL